MGNCFPNLKKKKKNKVYPGTTPSESDRSSSEVSEILSRCSSGSFIYSSCSSSSEELEMAKALNTPDEVWDLDDIDTENSVLEIRKPVFFQIDYVQGMPHRMPSRLAERMDQKPPENKPAQQATLTEEDELLMDEILAEANERLEQLIEQQIAAHNLRENRLNAIREKARSMRVRPSTRARRDGAGGNGSRGNGEGAGGNGSRRNGEGAGGNGDGGNGEGAAGGNDGGAIRDAGMGEGN